MRLWKRYRLWRAMHRLWAIERAVAAYEYDGRPVVWQALRLIESLGHKISQMREEL